MSVGLYMDEHVPSAITRALLLRGVDVLTVQVDKRIGADDAALLDRATELGRVLFTSDTDLLRKAVARLRDRIHFTGIIFVRQNTLTIGQVVAELELIFQAAEYSELADAIVYLPL